MNGNALIYRTVLQDKMTIKIYLEIFFLLYLHMLSFKYFIVTWIRLNAF